MGDKAKMPYRFYFYLVVRVRSDSSVGSHKLKFYWPASVNRMGCTRETRVISTDDHFKPIEQSFLWFSVLYYCFCSLSNPQIYRSLVVTGRNDHIGLRYDALIVCAVLVDERPSRRFKNTNACRRSHFGLCPNVCTGYVWIV